LLWGGSVSYNGWVLRAGFCFEAGSIAQADICRGPGEKTRVRPCVPPRISLSRHLTDVFREIGFSSHSASIFSTKK